MNIAIISPWAISKSASGGTERFVIDLATQLSMPGNRVEVFTLSGRSHSSHGIRYKSLNILGNGKVADEYDLRDYVNKKTGDEFYENWATVLEKSIDVSGFDIIHLNSLLFIDAWANSPRVFTIHTNPYEYKLDWGDERFNTLIQKIVNNLPRRTVLVAPSAHYARTYGKLFDREVLTIPHAIDIARLETGTSHSSPKSSPNRITILLPSRLDLVQKRPQVVFGGIALLPEDVKKHITLVATGKDLQYENNWKILNKFSQKNKIKSKFIKSKSMAKVYAMADIVALPSKSESFGYSALESLVLEIPTILNSIPTFREIGSGNPNAHFFDGTSESFSEVLLKQIGSLKRYKNTKLWLKRYDINVWAQTYLNLFRKESVK